MVGQQFFQPLHGMITQPARYVLQPHFRIYAVQFAGMDQGVYHGIVVCGLVIAGEEIILATDCHRADISSNFLAILQPKRLNSTPALPAKAREN